MTVVCRDPPTPHALGVMPRPAVRRDDRRERRDRRCRIHTPQHSRETPMTAPGPLTSPLGAGPADSASRLRHGCRVPAGAARLPDRAGPLVQTRAERAPTARRPDHWDLGGIDRDEHWRRLVTGVTICMIASGAPLRPVRLVDSSLAGKPRSGGLRGQMPAQGAKPVTVSAARVTSPIFSGTRGRPARHGAIPFPGPRSLAAPGLPPGTPTCTGISTTTRLSFFTDTPFRWWTSPPVLFVDAVDHRRVVHLAVPQRPGHRRGRQRPVAAHRTRRAGHGVGAA